VRPDEQVQSKTVQKCFATTFLALLVGIEAQSWSGSSVWVWNSTVLVHGVQGLLNKAAPTVKSGRGN
jgi:hypothetical protein